MINKILFELFCIYCVCGIPLAVRYGWYYWCIQTLIGYFSVFIDWILFPHTEKNLKRLEKYGYSRTHVALTMLLNLVLTNVLVAVIYINITIQSFSWAMVPKVIINLCITELLFTYAHALLHCTETGSKLHVMHHCCKHSSWSTNLIFHPLDMAAEFSGPVLSVLGMHLFWKDDNVLGATVLLVHLWYALDHSALLNLPHTKHHKYVDNMYSIYVKKHMRYGSDLVKSKINYL